MPRAFCPECAAEVPVDEEGRCFLGHQVPEASASGTTPSPQDVGDAVDEPEPWVASVTSEGAEAPDDEAVDDTTAPAGRATPVEEATPSTSGEAGTPRVGEVPDPTAEEEEVELDLDTLEQAVAEMGLTAEQDAEGDEDAFAVFEEEPRQAPASGPGSEGPEVEVDEGAVADVLETQGATPRPAETEPEPAPGPEPASEPEPERGPEQARAPEPEPTPEPEPEQPRAPEPEPEPQEAPEEPDEWAAFDAPAEPEAAEEERAAGEGPGDEPDEPEDEEPIDTANFLARPKGKRRGLFGR